MAAKSEDSNDSDCFVCSDGGDLLCCDFCIRAFHKTCLTPPLETLEGLPEEDWACPACSGFGQGRFGGLGDDQKHGAMKLGTTPGTLSKLAQGALNLGKTRETSRKSELVDPSGDVVIQRLDGLNSPIQGRALLGKLSPITPQIGEGARARTLRRRAGKDAGDTPDQKPQKEEPGKGNGVTSSRRKRAKEMVGAVDTPEQKPQEEVLGIGHGITSSRRKRGKEVADGLTEAFEFKMEVESEVDLRTPEMKAKEKEVPAGVGKSTTNGRAKKVRLSAAFKQVVGASTPELANGVVQDLEVQNQAPIGSGSALPKLELDEEDISIAARGRNAGAKRGGKQSTEAENGDIPIGGADGSNHSGSGRADGNVPAEKDNGAVGAVAAESVEKQRAPSRKRKTTGAEPTAEAGPSGAAPQVEPPAVEPPAVEAAAEPLRNRRRNRRAPAAEDAPAGDAAVAPAGGDAEGRDREDQGDRARARFLAIARRRAAHFAHFAGDDHVAEAEGNDEEAEDAPARRQVAAPDSDKDEPDWPGPFSTARKLVRERQAAVIAREEGSPGESATGPLVDWSPSRLLDVHFRRCPIPTLFEMSVRLLVDNAEFVESMEGIPDAVRRRVAAGFAARRKMIPETLSLFFQGCPGEIVLPDCTLVGEAEMTAAMAQTDAQRLEVLELGMCGRCITDQGLSATLASGVNTLPQLLTLSLRGAYRLTDLAVEKLLAAAPNMTSLELRKCSLMTDDVIRAVADALGGRVRGFSVEGCAQLDGARIQPSLLRLSGLRRLNLTGVSNVTDALIQELSVTLGSGLEELSLAGAKELSDASVAAISACCPNLALLDLDGVVKLTDVSVARLADGCRGVRHLSLKLGKFSDEALAAYVTASGSQIRHLCLNNVRKAGDATLVALAKHARDSLALLDVSWCRRVTDQGLGLLADSCRQLRSLRLYGCSQVTDVFLSGHSNAELVVLGQGDDVK